MTGIVVVGCNCADAIIVKSLLQLAINENVNSIQIISTENHVGGEKMGEYRHYENIINEKEWEEFIAHVRLCAKLDKAAGRKIFNAKHREWRHKGNKHLFRKPGRMNFHINR